MRLYEFQKLRKVLDFGHKLPLPQAVLINGHANGTSFTVEQGLFYSWLLLNLCYLFFIVTEL